METEIVEEKVKHKRGRKPKGQAVEVLPEVKVPKTPPQTQIKAIVKGGETSYALLQDPNIAVNNAKKVVEVLHKVIASKPKKVIINGEQYLEFEDWQLLGAPYGVTVKVVETKPSIDSLLLMKEPCQKFWAKAVAVQNGMEISCAEAICQRSEYNWKTKDDFQLLSMAQTRACAKAFRNIFAWVAVLAGYRPTPAEEIEGTSLSLPEGWRKINSRYPGKCASCEKEYQRGSEIIYNSAFKGARCLDCVPEIGTEFPEAKGTQEK